MFCRLIGINVAWLIGINVVGSNDVMKKKEYSRYPNLIWVGFKG